MSDIQRYMLAGEKWIKEADHIKAMEAKDESIQVYKDLQEMAVNKLDEYKATIFEQTKDIEKLKYFLKVFINNKNDEDDDLSVNASKHMGYRSVFQVVREVQNGDHK